MWGHDPALPAGEGGKGRGGRREGEGRVEEGGKAGFMRPVQCRGRHTMWGHDIALPAGVNAKGGLRGVGRKGLQGREAEGRVGAANAMWGQA